ncbi:hypothetical protein COL922a_012825 [Colletotrichum nupharicola]|nr:hypothetical protein COL922a_012825 [Colletotrichum nupharicola]
MSWPTSSFLDQVTAYGAYLEHILHLLPSLRFFTNDTPQFFASRSHPPHPRLLHERLPAAVVAGLRPLSMVLRENQRGKC